MYMERKVFRGCVRVFNVSYYSPGLEIFEGLKVHVKPGLDFVDVFDVDGVFLCRAELKEVCPAYFTKFKRRPFMFFYEAHVKVEQGRVAIYGNTYSNPMLAGYEGETVEVGPIGREANRVWVQNQLGEYLGSAGKVENGASTTVG